MTTQRKFLLLILCTVCSRAFFLALSPGTNYYKGISEGFLHVANNVLEGRGITTYVDLAPTQAPMRQWTYEPFIDRPLGYLLMILVPYSIVRHPLSVQVFQICVSVFSVILCYRVAKRIFSEQTAFLAALLYALWPLSARFEVVILGDSVVSFFLLLSMWFLLKGLEQEQFGYLLSSGLSLGIGILMRSDLSLFVLFLLGLIYFAKGSRVALRTLTPLTVGVLVVIGLQTAHNYSATRGSILPLGLGKGISLWEGISQFGDTKGTLYGDERLAAKEGYPAWAYPNGVERDDIRFKEAVGIILDHPVWYAGIMLRRIPYLLTPDWIVTNPYSMSFGEYFRSNPESTLFDYVQRYPFQLLVKTVIVLLQYVVLLFASIALWSNRGNSASRFPGIVILYYVLIHLPTNTEARYFYPVIPFVLMCAAQYIHSRLSVHLQNPKG